VYRWDTLVLLRHLLDQGLSKSAIAARLGVSRRVIYYWLATGQLDRDVSAPAPPRQSARRAQKLDPFTPIIRDRLATYPELSAVRLLAECRAAGYTGGVTQLRAFVATARPQPEPAPLIRFETPPGHQAQVDFATVHFPWGTRYALLVVLGYSRLLWLRFYPRQTMQTVMAGLEEAFASFGGVPHECLFDQLKAVVVEDERPAGGKLVANPEFLRFAAHWGFRIRACRPYRAQTKGKVERPVRYLRESFVYGREFLGDGDLAHQATQWLADVANARVHATTREAPAVRFARDEQALLLPLAARPYRPLVLPTERRREPGRTTRIAVPLGVHVERRSLATYAHLVDQRTRAEGVA
jgi:transposase